MQNAKVFRLQAQETTVATNPDRQALQNALRAFHAGRFDQAERLCEGLLPKHPTDVRVLQLAGMAKARAGKLDDGLSLIDRAIALRPDEAGLQLEKGTLLVRRGDFRAALQPLKKASLGPNGAQRAQASFQRALAFQGLAEVDKAVSACHDALERAPDHGPARNLLGSLELQRGNRDVAERIFEQIVERHPDDAEAWNNLGSLRMSKGAQGAAIEAYREALRLRPDSLTARLNLGKGLVTTGEAAEGVDVLTGAVRQAPENPHTHLFLGLALRQAGQLDNARRALQTAVDIDPDSPEHQMELGEVLLLGRDYPAARTAFAEALSRQPTSLRAQQGDMRARLALADWDGLETAVMGLLEASEKAVDKAPRSIDLAQLATLPTRIDTARLKALAEKISRQWPAANKRVGKTARSRPRLGVISSRFDNEAALQTMIGFLGEPAARDHELFVYVASSRIDDGTRQRIDKGANRVVEVAGLDDAALEGRLREDELDILIELDGHLPGNRLGALARKPAPLQGSYLGTFSTTGAPFIDFYLGDPFITGDEQANNFTERLLVLETAWLINDPERPLPRARPGRENLGLPADALVLAAFHSVTSLDPDTFDQWIALLRENPSSVLWLTEGRPIVRERLQAHVEKAGLDTGRLIFATPGNQSERLSLLRQADLFLDTHHLSNGLGVSEALWMGVPAITWAGERPLSRTGASLAKHCGLDALIAETASEYRARAQQLISDEQAREKLAQRLRRDRRKLPIFDETTQQSAVAQAIEALTGENAT